MVEFTVYIFIKLLCDNHQYQKRNTNKTVKYIFDHWNWQQNSRVVLKCKGLLYFSSRNLHYLAAKRRNQEIVNQTVIQSFIWFMCYKNSFIKINKRSA